MAKRGTTRGFSQSVNKWTKEAEKRSEEAFQNGALDFYDALRNATPVLTGNLRDSWVATLNGDTSMVTGPGDSPNTSNNRSGIETSVRNISNAKLGDKISYMNHAPYFLRIERGFVGFDSLGRYYNQAGRWFSKQVGARYVSIMRAAATRLRIASK